MKPDQGKRTKVTFGIFIIGIAFFFSTLSYAIPSQATNEFRVNADLGHVDAVEVTVLVDNYPNGTLQNPWGVSMLVETSDFTILMDAGPEPDALMNNAAALGKDLSLVDYVVISHEHGDHYFGLPYVAQVNPNITVYVPQNMATMVKSEIADLGFDVVGVSETTILSSGIAIIGQLWGPPYEHALTINVENVGLVTTVGCSHPGVEEIVGKAVEDLEVAPYLVIGGFHLAQASEYTISNTVTTLLNLGVDLIYPIHCSGDATRAYIQENYPDNYGEGCIGTHLVINQESVSTGKSSLSSTTILVSLIIIPLIGRLLGKRKAKK